VTKKMKSQADILSVPTASPAAAITILVHRPGGVTSTVQGQDISYQVVANGTLLIVGPTGKPSFAFSPSQWLSVGTPPV
jgi:hypothetical protein